MTLPNHAVDFHRAEFDALRKEIDAAVQEARALDRYALVAVGGIFAWLAIHAARVPSLAWWIPVLLAFLGFLRSMALLYSINRAGEYIWTLEAALCSAPPLGWQHYLWSGRAPESSARTRGLRSRVGPVFVTTGGVFWLLLLVASIYGALRGPGISQRSAKDARMCPTHVAVQPAHAADGRFGAASAT